MNKVALEVAQVELDRFIELMDLDLDTSDLDEEDCKELEKQKKLITSAICNGSLVINDDGEPVFTPRRTTDANPITFHEPTGASLTAMDRRKRGEDIGKAFSVMGDITGQGAKTFAAMKMGDLKVCQAITALFLG